jgi:hypothetical protein
MTAKELIDVWPEAGWIMVQWLRRIGLCNAVASRVAML